MKKILIFILVTIPVVLCVNAQTGSSFKAKSKTKQITFTRNVNTNVVRLLPDLQISDQAYVDQNRNNMIDADEDAFIKFKLHNLGEGEAQQVKIQASLLNGPITGLLFTREMDIGNVYPTQTKDIEIPVSGEMDLVNNVAKFKIEVIEKNGLDAYPFEMEIQSREFSKPDVIIADAVFSTEDGGMIKLNYPINLKVLVQNIGEGDAKDVKALFMLENTNCIMLDESNEHYIGLLKVGESRELDFTFTATRRYEFDQIPVRVILSENYGLYAENKSLSVGLEENLVGNTAVVIKGIETEKTDVEMASLTAEVDKNIPVNPLKHPNRIALIIGNEDYSSRQRDLGSESDVRYARNDARIFREYVTKTLGVKEENLFLLIDATAGEMEQNIELVSKLAGRIGEESEIIFYYAGHGLPDQVNEIPYLIPVDVSGSNLGAAIKLLDVYRKLSESGAGRITVFLDACFSGGGREAGLLAARAVKIKPKEDQLTGNMIVFSASSNEQSALPYREKQHGMFTYFLLKKIQDSGGDVTYSELGDYVSRNVSIESLRINQQEQDPGIRISMEVEGVWREWRVN